MTRPAEPVYRFVEDLKTGDIIAEGFLPLKMRALVLHSHRYRYAGEDRVFVMFQYSSGEVDGTSLLANGAAPVEAKF